MGTYSNHSCHICSIKRPANLMIRTKISQKSGSSGFGVSFNPHRKKSIRVSAPRNYYRTRTVWVCNDEKAHNNPKYYEEKVLRDLQNKFSSDLAIIIIDNSKKIKEKADLIALQISEKIEKNLDINKAKEFKIIKPILDKVLKANKKNLICEIDKINFKIFNSKINENIGKFNTLIEQKKISLWNVLFNWICALLILFYGTGLVIFFIRWILINNKKKKIFKFIDNNKSFFNEINKDLKNFNLEVKKINYLETVNLLEDNSDKKDIYLGYWDKFPANFNVFKSTFKKNNGHLTKFNFNTKKDNGNGVINDTSDIPLVETILALGLAQIDGKLEESEFNQLIKNLNVDEKKEKELKNVWEKFKQKNIKNEHINLAKQIGKTYKKELLLKILNNLFFIGEADNLLDKEEIKLLKTYATLFGISNEDFEKISSNNFHFDDQKFDLIDEVDDEYFEE